MNIRITLKRPIITFSTQYSNTMSKTDQSQAMTAGINSRLVHTSTQADGRLSARVSVWVIRLTVLVPGQAACGPA